MQSSCLRQLRNLLFIDRASDRDLERMLFLIYIEISNIRQLDFIIRNSIRHAQCRYCHHETSRQHFTDVPPKNSILSSFGFLGSDCVTNRVAT